MRWLRRRAEAPAPAPALPKTEPPRLSEFDRTKTNEVLTDAVRIRHRDLVQHHVVCTVPVVAWRVRYDEVFDTFNVRHVFPGLDRATDEDVEEFHQVGGQLHKGPLTGCYNDACGQAATAFRRGRWAHHCAIPECPKYLVPEPVPSNVRTFPL